MTELVIAQLLYLQWVDPRLPVYVYLNSTGTSRADGETVRPHHIRACFHGLAIECQLRCRQEEAGSRDPFSPGPHFLDAGREWKCCWKCWLFA